MGVVNTVFKVLVPFTILFVIFGSYYSFVFPQSVIINTTPEGYWQTMLVYHLVFLMLIWSFFVVLCTPVSKVPPPYKLGPEILRSLKEAKSEEEFNAMIINYCLLSKIRLWTRTETGCIRYNDKNKNLTV